jgi:hypothetical protein
MQISAKKTSIYKLAMQSPLYRKPTLYPVCRFNRIWLVLERLSPMLVT